MTPTLFPDWDLCAGMCDRLVLDCGTSNYLDWDDCWGRSKVNVGLDQLGGCAEEGHALRLCLANLDQCSDYEALLDEKPSPCSELATKWETTCTL